MMPDDPEIQANVTLLFDIEKEVTNANKNKEELKNYQKATTRSLAGKSSDKIPVKRKKEFNKNHPSKFLYCSDAAQKNTKADTYNLFKDLQIQKCSVYCMRKRKYL